MRKGGGRVLRRVDRSDKRGRGKTTRKCPTSFEKERKLLRVVLFRAKPLLCRRGWMGDLPEQKEGEKNSRLSAAMLGGGPLNFGKKTSPRGNTHPLNLATGRDGGRIERGGRGAGKEPARGKNGLPLT